MTPAHRRPLALLLLWAAGAAAWNIEGVRRMAAGLQPLGPTASLAGAAVIGLLALMLVVGSRWSRVVVLLASGLILLASGAAVWGAFAGTPDQWPSPAWRWSGVALNAMGLLAAVAMLRIAARRA